MLQVLRDHLLFNFIFGSLICICNFLVIYWKVFTIIRLKQRKEVEVLRPYHACVENCVMQMLYTKSSQSSKKGIHLTGYEWWNRDSKMWINLPSLYSQKAAKLRFKPSSVQFFYHHMLGLSPVSLPYEPVTRININVFKSKKTLSRNLHNFKKHLNLLTVFHAFPSFTFRLCMF